MQDMINTGKGVKLDLRTKLFCMLILTACVFSASNWMILSVAAVMALSASLGVFKYKNTVLLALFYSAAIFSDVFIVDYNLPEAANIVIVMLSGFVCRMTPSMVMGYYLFKTTTVSEFVASMERMHIPKQIIIPFSVMFRFFPTIKEESSSINDAMKMRGISFGKTRGGPVAMLEYRLVPLFISCVKIGDELSMSALTRGLGSPARRTNICDVGFHVQDILYFLLGCVVLTLFIILI